MKIGLGLYRRFLQRENYQFAKQAGCTHLVVHLVNYFEDSVLHGTDAARSWGVVKPDGLWTVEELSALKHEINDEGLELEAIENFYPSHWSDILLDGPRKQQQIEDVKTMIRNVGKAGIPIIGYNFSIAGVWGHVEGPWARGGARAVGFLGEKGPEQTPIPKGTVWNMVYDPQAEPGTIGSVTSEELWERLEDFLKEVVPVAEEAGVRLAAHPDDPPMPELRGTARLVYQPQLYQRLLDIVPSPSNALEFCMGTIQEMAGGSMDIYEALDAYTKQNAIAYIHFRNVKGKVPDYREVFLDEGDIDMVKALHVLHRNDYDGVIIPDHTPLITCDAPWHAGMAYALGWMRSALQMIERES